MPLNKENSCSAFFQNRAELIKAGKEKDQATAIAASVLKEAGGDPSKCVSPKKDGEDKKED